MLQLCYCPDKAGRSAYRCQACVALPLAGVLTCIVRFSTDGPTLTIDSVPEAPGCLWGPYTLYFGQLGGGCGIHQTVSQEQFDAAFQLGVPVNISASVYATWYDEGVYKQLAITATQAIELPASPLLAAKGLSRTYVPDPEGGEAETSVLVWHVCSLGACITLQHWSTCMGCACYVVNTSLPHRCLQLRAPDCCHCAGFTETTQTLLYNAGNIALLDVRITAVVTSPINVTCVPSATLSSLGVGAQVFCSGTRHLDVLPTWDMYHHNDAIHVDAVTVRRDVRGELQSMPYQVGHYSMLGLEAANPSFLLRIKPTACYAAVQARNFTREITQAVLSCCGACSPCLG